MPGPLLTQRAEMEPGRKGEHEKGKQDCEHELSLLQNAANAGCPSPSPTWSVAAPTQPTVSLTTTATVAKIRVLGTFCMFPTSWDLDVSTVQTPGDKQCGPLCLVFLG